MELFNQEKTIFMDGGMGTMLQARGLQAGQAPDLWNITHPQEVEAVHLPIPLALMQKSWLRPEKAFPGL